jgi:hypothetical protein
MLVVHCVLTRDVEYGQGDVVEVDPRTKFQGTKDSLTLALEDLTESLSGSLKETKSFNNTISILIP